MKMNFLVNLLVVLPAWLVTTSASPTYTGMQLACGFACDVNATTWTRASKAWDGTVFNYLGGNNSVYAAEQGLEKCIKNATTEASRTATLTAAQGASCISYINGTFEPDVKTALDAFVARKANITRAGLLSVAKQQVATLKNLTGFWGGNLTAKIQPAQRAAVQSLFAKFTADYNAANATLYS